MKPKAPSEHEDGILEYLEDIIGTNVYKEPIEELGRRVEELNEARGEKVCAALHTRLHGCSARWWE